MARHLLMVGLALALIVGLIVPLGSAGEKLDPVKVKAEAGKADDGGKQTVTVQVSIEKGWHIYANPVENEDLAQAQTTVIIKAAGKAVTAKVKYPAGKPLTEKGVGTFKVYEEAVSIQAEVAKTPGPLEVSVRFQACNDKKCLLPKTVKISLP